MIDRNDVALQARLTKRLAAIVASWPREHEPAVIVANAELYNQGYNVLHMAIDYAIDQKLLQVLSKHLMEVEKLNTEGRMTWRVDALSVYRLCGVIK